MTTDRRANGPLILEIAAALMVPAACYGFVRVFIEQGALGPIVGAAVLSTAVAVLLRRIRVPLAAAAALSFAFLGALIMNRFAPGTARLGIIPTGDTIAAFDALIADLVDKFRELKTPVEAINPFIATAMIAAWIMAFLTDWGAHRLRLAFEPVLPAGLIFVFTSVLGTGDDQVFTTVLFGASIAFWAVVQRSVNLAEGNSWLVNDRRRGSIAVAQAAGLLAAIAVAAGVVVGPRLPGAEAEEMLSFRDDGDPTRVVVSPFVSIESRLVSQVGTRLFTVTSSQASYWRLAGLDTYENDIWKVAGNFSPEDGELPGRDTQGGVRDEVQQDFSIQALAEIWLPAAYAPSEIVDSSARLTWNAESGSLTVANDIPTSDGVDYSLVSSIPRFTSEELRAAPDTIPPEIAERYLALPAIPQVVRDEADRVTAGAATRYDRALALQDYFQNSGNFTYNVNLQPSNGADPLEHFLATREGFCQQFAGTFAVMARHLGIPARVAIGFTWGDPISEAEDGRTVYAVSGRQTHAWPEVWFDGLGWVAFEPTPGRGAPGAVEYTRLPASQDSLVQPDNPNGPVTTTTLAPSNADAGDLGPAVPDIPLGDEGAVVPATNDGGIPVGTILRVLAVLAVIGAYAGGIPAYHEYRRQRRRQQIDSPAAEVETAWAEATESLELGFELSRRSWETRREFARRLAADMRVPREPMDELAEKVTVARYHPAGLRKGDGARATELSGEITHAVNQRVPIFTRWSRMVDPRRLVQPSARIATTAPAGNATSNGHHSPTRTSERPKANA